MLNNPCWVQVHLCSTCDSEQWKPWGNIPIKLWQIMKVKSNKGLRASSLLAFNFPAAFELLSKQRGGDGGEEARYKMSHSSEQRPETSNSQLNRITLSGLTDRAVDGFVVRREVKRGTGGVGDLDREKVMRKQEVNDGKSRGRRGLLKPFGYGALPLMKETIHRGRSLTVSSVQASLL